VLCWCLRLGLHIAGRTKSVTDDPRYRDLIQTWGHEAPLRLFWFLQAQAAVGTILVVSVALAAHNDNPSVRALDVAGLLLLLGSIVGEAIADRQLHRFKADPLNREEVCDIGLWSWSRHPNYFFEWLLWVGVAIIAVDISGYQPFGWLAISAPVCMYWVLNYASGIPPLEAHMLRSRGDKFVEYQTRTSAFFPLPPGAKIGSAP
jgi:steroid 5-alpha reductase family enzyme